MIPIYASSSNQGDYTQPYRPDSEHGYKSSEFLLPEGKTNCQIQSYLALGYFLSNAKGK
jgi:hypothetical protein